MSSTPKDSWFWLDGGRPAGPLSAEQLRAAASAGKVRPETLVRCADSQHWRQAGQVPGLFPSRLAVPPACPPPPLPKPKPPPGTASTPGPVRLAAPPERPNPPSPPPPPPPPRFTAGPNAAPPLPEPSLAGWLGIAVAEADGPASAPEAKRRRKHPPLSVFLGLLVALVVCVALVVAIVIAPPDAHAPAKRPVAQVPKKPDAVATSKTPKRQEAEEMDFPATGLGTNFIGEAGCDRSTFELPTPPTPKGRIDELVFAKWKQLRIEPAHPCSDAVFLRRVYLDVIGTLPTVEEARAFLADKSPQKRKKLIDALLERREFADFWAMKWSDLLRVKAEFPINLWPNAAQAYHRWIRNAIRDNVPYDKFVRALLTSSGSNFRVPQVNFYRALQSRDPKGIARAVALSFMGCRAEKWPEERLAGMSAFFFKVGYKRTGEWKEEIVFFDPHKTDPPPPPPKPKAGPRKGGEKRTGRKRAGQKKTAEKKLTEKKIEKKVEPVPLPKPVLPDGTPVEIAWNKDPRQVFADWLVTPKNPWFTRQIVNRVWYWLVGRGIVQEPDDIRPDNPPSNPELLNYLAEELIESHYDLKHIYRLVLNSSTYQLSSLPRSKRPEAAVHFASYTVRRLEAEVIIDALNQITGTTESYSSIIPEPYTFIPQTRRAIALPDGSITSSFLELFGRPPRDSGLESERNNRITAAQRLHLLNSSHIRNKLRDGPALKKLLAEPDASANLYLAVLSRFPGPGEGASRENLAWALINSTEFLFRH